MVSFTAMEKTRGGTGVGERETKRPVLDTLSLMPVLLGHEVETSRRQLSKYRAQREERGDLSWGEEWGIYWHIDGI